MFNIEKHWYRSSFTSLTLLLLPLSWIFSCIVMLRRFLYSHGFKKVYHFSVPVIIVGNITVGGTGKTPFVIWLANHLKEQGFIPGIVSRGVGGKQQQAPRWVDEAALATDVGDEALLLKKQTQCPMVIAIDRAAAVSELIAKTNCNIIINDDGLQHYRLGRDIEIAIVDGARRFGNQHLLPAGPLRESISRLMEVDFIIAQQFAQVGEYEMSVKGESLISLNHPDNHISLISFKNKKVHAVAAIGNPQRFFTSLKDAGIEVVEHVFPDHYLYQKSDFEFDDALPIVMTEKDAVKCSNFAMENAWYLPVTAKLDPLFENKLNEKLEALRRK